MNNNLRIGLIQPVIDPILAWGKNPYQLNIDKLLAEVVWAQIKSGLKSMVADPNRPDIILIPELHLPVSKIADMKRFSKKYNIMLISGVDFQRNPKHENKIRNRGIITIPNQWGLSNRSSRVTTLHFGKTFFTYMEREMFNTGILNGSVVEICTEDREQNMYIFTSKSYGNFGVMICSDIFDIERMMLYQGRIHHLFIISLNQDLNTYFSMSESLTRLLYCNVVVCNTGHFGGSLAVSPYSDPNERTIYKYVGQRMFNTHVVDIPVLSLDAAQRFDFAKEKKKEKGIVFKASPPGYRRFD